MKNSEDERQKQLFMDDYKEVGLSMRDMQFNKNLVDQMIKAGPSGVQSKKDIHHRGEEKVKFTNKTYAWEKKHTKKDKDMLVS